LVLLKKIKSFPFKLEVLTITVSILYAVIEQISKKSLFSVQNIIKYYEKINASEKNADIISFIAITIGIYISVITIISTSRIPASKQILENNLDNNLIFFIFGAVIMNIIEIMYLLFVPNFKFYVIFYFTLMIIQVTILIKFLCLVLYICKINVNEVVNEIDEDTKNREDLYNILCIIQDELKK